MNGAFQGLSDVLLPEPAVEALWWPLGWGLGVGLVIGLGWAVWRRRTNSVLGRLSRQTQRGTLDPRQAMHQAAALARSANRPLPDGFDARRFTRSAPDAAEAAQWIARLVAGPAR